MPDVTRSRLLAREGELAIAEFVAPPYGHQKLDLEFIQSPRDSVVFTQVDRYREDGIFGRFELAAAVDGSGTMVTTRLPPRSRSSRRPRPASIRWDPTRRSQTGASGHPGPGGRPR